VRSQALFLSFALFACNREDAPPPAPIAEQTAKAPSTEVQQKRAAAREAADKQAAAEAERVRTELEALAQLPTELPKTLPKACDAMVAAYDAYMRRVLTDDMLTKWTTGGNEMQVTVFRKECLGRSIPVAACQTQALAKLTREQYPRLADLMGLCAQKFGAAEGKPK
jgi:hypothetical protein